MACFYLLTRKESASITKLRTLDTPTRFESKNEYCSHFYNLVNEHLQVMLSEKALRYHSISRADESAFRSNGLAVYIDCQLKRIANDNETLCVLCTSSGSISMDSNTSRFSKDDVWIVSAQPDFSNAMVCRSNYFGASSNGSFEVFVGLTRIDGTIDRKGPGNVHENLAIAESVEPWQCIRHSRVQCCVRVYVSGSCGCIKVGIMSDISVYTESMRPARQSHRHH